MGFLGVLDSVFFESIPSMCKTGMAMTVVFATTVAKVIQ